MTITRERAQEIYHAGQQWSNWSKHCTAEEDAEIRGLWKSLPGYTCWFDALLRFAFPERWEKIISTGEKVWIDGPIECTDGKDRWIVRVRRPESPFACTQGEYLSRHAAEVDFRENWS